MTPFCRALPLVEELEASLDSWQCFLRIQSLPHPLFFDSSLSHPLHGRYSFLTADPFEWIISEEESSRDVHSLIAGTGPLAELAQRLAKYRLETLPDLPPFQGGAAGLFGYDLCHCIEKLPRPRFNEFQCPHLAVGFYDWVIAFDHAQRRSWLISTGLPATNGPRRRLRAEKRLQELKKRLLSAPQARSPVSTSESARPVPPDKLAQQFTLPIHHGLTSNFHRAGYLNAVRRAIEYTQAGDCFQVNLSQRLLYPALIEPVELYRRLREQNPSPFGGYFDLGDFTIVSASPERFLSLRQGEIEARPIKGTRPRGQTPAEDQTQVASLLASTKDRAENVMIVDLLRNDLGRVCQYGSVHVAALCRLESYPFVHHLVSEVRGRLRCNLGPIDLLRAAFPGGSVTGAPKIRAMEIIAELEPTARGPYCGSLGYIGFDGTMDTNILIRTFTVGRGWIQFPVGGGIVADSVPEQEYEETLHKAEGLLRALG